MNFRNGTLHFRNGLPRFYTEKLDELRRNPMTLNRPLFPRFLQNRKWKTLAKRINAVAFTGSARIFFFMFRRFAKLKL